MSVMWSVPNFSDLSADFCSKTSADMWQDLQLGSGSVSLEKFCSVDGPGQEETRQGGGGRGGRGRKSGGLD